MSWEYQEYIKSCPCGKGKIRVIHGSNDWGQTSNDETILCDECREKAENSEKAKQERNKVFKDLKDIVESYFKEHYMEKWISTFSNAKSKKDVWTIATRAKVETRSLNVFYSKCKSVDKYIEGLVFLVNLPLIITSLEITDQELEKLLEEPLRLHAEIHSEWLGEAYLHFKGR